MMFNVYEVNTWDNFTYKKLSSFDKKEDAEKEAEKLNAERRSQPFDYTDCLVIIPAPICYCVMSDLLYDFMMNDQRWCISLKKRK